MPRSVLRGGVATRPYSCAHSAHFRRSRQTCLLNYLRIAFVKLVVRLQPEHPFQLEGRACRRAGRRAGEAGINPAIRPHPRTHALTNRSNYPSPIPETAMHARAKIRALAEPRAHTRAQAACSMRFLKDISSDLSGLATLSKYFQASPRTSCTQRSGTARVKLA